MTFSPVHRRKSLLPVVTLAAAAVTSGITATPAYGISNLGSIRLTSERSSLRPDGKSTSVISAQVFDDKGNVVADGTRVRFSTTAGRLDASVAVTQSGVARVTLTSADQAGEARIVAIVEAPGQSVPARITISFTTQTDNASTGTAWAHFDGSQYVGYIMDYGIVHVTGKDGGARLEWRGLRVTADIIQFNVKENSFKAVGNVTLTKGGITRTYGNLLYALAEETGVGERFENDVSSVYFIKGAELAEAPPATGQFRPQAETWALEDLSGAGVTVVSRSILLEPGARLQFRRATFYLDGNKTVSLPYHIMNLGQASLFRDQLFGLGPQGPTIDLPLYYDVRPNAVGTLHLRRGARQGTLTSSARPGWTMDIEQAYSGRSGTDGVFEFYGLARSDWGARLRHGQRLDKQTTGSLYVDFPNHRDLFVTSQLSRFYKNFNINGTLSGTRTQGFRDPLTNTTGKPGGDIRGQVYAETFDKPLGGEQKIRYVLNTSLARQTYYGQAFFNADGTTQGVSPSSANTITTEAVGTRLFTRPIRVNRDTSFTQSLSLGQNWVQGQGVASGISTQGTSTLNRKIGVLGLTSLSYDYTQTPLLPRLTSYTATPRHRLGYSLSLSPGPQWSMDWFSSRGLDIAQSTINGNLQFRIGGPWQGRVSYSAAHFSGVGYREVEYALIRTIGGRDFSVYYSTTARRFQLDFSGARF